VALCLEPHDLVLSKCAAGRERDWQFARDMLRASLVSSEELLARVSDLPVDEATRAHIRSMLRAMIVTL
jgi:hypothetical protein